MSFPRYPAYKDSGVEMVPEVPERWAPTRLRFLLRDGYDGIKIGPFGSQLTSDMLVDDGDYKVFGQENVIANDFLRGSRYIDKAKFEELSVYEIKSGDLLITMMGTSGRCDVVPLNTTQGIMDSHLLRMRVTPAVRPEFVRLLIDEAAYVGNQVELAGKGSIMHGLNSTIVKNLLLFVPPDDEQAQIMCFLDRETAKIDALVAEQEKLIELLKEKRQAVISHAVTKGLDPSVPMKDSGVEWLGEVPTHWEVTTIKRIVSTPVTDGPHETPAFYDGGVPFVSAEAVSSGRIDFDRIRGFISVEDHQRYSQKYIPQRGDIFMIKSGATTGIAAIVETDVEFNIWSPLAVIRCGPDVLPRFALHFIRSRNFQEGVTLGWSFGTQQNIGMGVIENLAIVVPPMEVQERVVELLDMYTNQADSLIGEAQTAISLLQERRTALISAAVTGQIDVRNSVAMEQRHDSALS